MSDVWVLLSLGFMSGIAVTLVTLLPRVHFSKRRAARKTAAEVAELTASLEGTQADLEAALRQPAIDLSELNEKLNRAYHEIALRDAQIDEALLRADRLERRFQALRAAILEDQDAMSELEARHQPQAPAPISPVEVSSAPQKPVGSKGDLFAAVDAATLALMEGETGATWVAPAPPRDAPTPYARKPFGRG